MPEPAKSLPKCQIQLELEKGGEKDRYGQQSFPCNRNTKIKVMKVTPDTQQLVKFPEEGWPASQPEADRVPMLICPGQGAVLLPRLNGDGVTRGKTLGTHSWKRLSTDTQVLSVKGSCGHRVNRSIGKSPAEARPQDRCSSLRTTTGRSEVCYLHLKAVSTLFFYNPGR